MLLQYSLSNDFVHSFYYRIWIMCPTGIVVIDCTNQVQGQEAPDGKYRTRGTSSWLLCKSSTRFFYRYRSTLYKGLSPLAKSAVNSRWPLVASLFPKQSRDASHIAVALRFILTTFTSKNPLFQPSHYCKTTISKGKAPKQTQVP